MVDVSLSEPGDGYPSSPSHVIAESGGGSVVRSPGQGPPLDIGNELSVGDEILAKLAAGARCHSEEGERGSQSP